MRLSTNLVVALFCGCQGLLFWNFSPRFPSPTFGRSVRSAGPTSSSSHDAATTKAKEALESRAGAAHGRLSSYPQTDDVSSVVKATAVQEARPGIPKHTASKENGGRLCQVIDAATFSSSRYADARGASGDANVCCVRKRTSKTKPFIIHLHCNPSELTRAVLANGLWENGITARMTSVLQRLRPTSSSRTPLFMDCGGNVGSVLALNPSRAMSRSRAVMQYTACRMRLCRTPITSSLAHGQPGGCNLRVLISHAYAAALHLHH